MRWEKKSEAMKTGSGPGKRWGHTCNAIRGGKLVYVFGGYGQHNCQTNQVHVFDTDSQTWGEPPIKGTPPTPRDSHTCTAVGDNLFVFGGTDGLNPLRDLHILDTSSNTWVSPSVRGNGPEAREGHSAALVGKRLFIFGGCGKSMNNSDEVYYNDLYVLDTETFVWQRAVTSGTPPAARDSHSCSSWRNNIVVIGGEDAHDYYLSDVHILDTDNLVWRELNTSGQLFPPRAGHSTVAFGKNLFVFGGFTDAQNLYDDLYMLDVDNGIWAKITATGDGPSARFSMSGDCLDPSKSGVLVFIGGCDKNLEALDDMYYLHTELVRDDGREERRLEKLSLRKQLKLKCQEQYIPFSGHDNALVAFGTADPGLPNHSQQSQQYFHLNTYRPTTGKRAFQAKVTKNFANGYTIETVIDGKPLRGILFSTSSSTTNPVPDRKKNAENVESLSKDQDPVTKLPTSHGSHIEAGSASIMKDTGHSDAGPSQEVIITDPHNLVGPSSIAEGNETDGAGASTTENMTTVENPPATVQGSGVLPTNQADDQVAGAERT